MSVGRRRFLQIGLLGTASLSAVALATKALYADSAEEMVIENDLFKLPKNPDKIDPVNLSNDEWRKRLKGLAYHVLREEGTERPYTSPLNDEKRKGEFVCAGCGLLLFHSDTKYDSGTGWPSFYDVVSKNIGTSIDYKIIYPRTEYHCKRCGGHQGHVFEDGPKPTGLRYCNNGVALRFIPA